MNAKRENNYITPDSATLRQSSNSHNMNGSISIPCSLMMTTVCPHLNATDMRECVLCGRRTVRNELYKRSKHSNLSLLLFSSFVLTFRSLFGKELNFSNIIFPRKPCILYKPHINQICLLLHMVHALKVLTLHSLLRLFLYLQGCMRLYLLLQCLLFQVQ